MAVDEELRLHISATDGTEAALRSISSRMRREAAEIQRGVIRLADGTKVFSYAIQRQADAMGVSYRSLLGHINSNASAAQRMGTNITTAGGQAAVAAAHAGRLGTNLANVSRYATAATGSLGRMATGMISAGAALEVARRGVVGFADWDLALRHVQNATNMSASGIKELGDEVVRLQTKTGIAKVEILEAFEEFRERSNMAPQEVMRLLPNLLQMAQGLNAPIKSTFAMMASAIRILKIDVKDLPLVFETTSHAANELQLDIKKLAPEMSKLASAAAARGYTGIEGLQRVVTMLGLVKTEQDDAADAANRLTSILEKMGDETLAKLLNFNSGQDLDNWLKAHKDQVGALVDYINQLNEEEQYKVRQFFGIRDAAAWRTLMGAFREYSGELVKTKNAAGAMQRGLNISDAPAKDIDRIKNAITELNEELGKLLVELGTLTAIKWTGEGFGVFMNQIKFMKNMVGWVFGGERPEGLPATWDEQNFIATQPRDKEGKPLMTYREYQAGVDPKRVQRDYNEKTKKAEEEKAAAEAVRKEADHRKRLEELKKKYPDMPIVVPPASATPPAQKMSLTLDKVNDKFVALLDAVDASPTVKAGLYGTSSNSRFLRASYSPSGAWGGPGGAGIGPGSAGTGYGGGTTGAMPPGSGIPVPPDTGGRRNQPAPTGPGGVPRPPGASPQTSGSQRERIATAKAAIRAELLRQGVPEANVDEAANLLAGQALSESNLIPGTQHDKDRFGNPTGYGIYGARLGRRDKMLKWLKDNGYAPDSLEGQSRYMAIEAMTDPTYAKSRKALMEANRANRQANVETLTKNFENPKDQGPGQMARRRTEADRAASVTDAPAPTAAPSEPSTAKGAGDVTHKGSGAAVDPALQQQLAYAGVIAGVRTNIAHGDEPGHSRHRKGMSSADLDLYDESGRKLDSRIPADREKMAKYIEASVAAGATGVGMGSGTDYMGPSRMHIGGGTPAVWGARGKGANTPQWVRDAYERGRARRVTPEQQRTIIAEARRKQEEAQQAATPSVGAGGREASRQSREYDQGQRTGPMGGTVEENYDALQKRLLENPEFGYGEGEAVPGIDVTTGRSRGGAHPLPPPGHIQRELNQPYGTDADQGERLGAREQQVRLDLKVNDTEVQFARASMRRQADREVREARWNSYSDIGSA